MGLTYEVRGHNNIDRNKGGVVIINHQSGIDLVGMKSELLRTDIIHLL